MEQPFIRNHQYNLIKRQAGLLLHACNTVSDRKVVEAVRYSVLTRIVEAFLSATEDQEQLLGNISGLQTERDFKQYLSSLEPFLTTFGPLTEKDLKKLFPKIKKLKVPDLTTVDFRNITYLGWTDIAMNKMFLVYPWHGRFVGIEGRFTPTTKKSVCFLCKRMEEAALFSAVTNSRPANASPDYYKSIGNYVCLNSDICNKNITDVTALETFVREVMGD